jgi:hypothetical protein
MTTEPWITAHTRISPVEVPGSDQKPAEILQSEKAYGSQNPPGEQSQDLPGEGYRLQFGIHSVTFGLVL